MKKSQLIIILIILASFLIAGFLYPQMPEKMASHWNSRGQVDDYLPKFWGLFLMPIISLVIFLFFLLIPKIDPLKENIEKFRKYFDGFIILIFIFLFYIYLLTIFWNLDYRFNLSQMMVPALAVLFFYCGLLIEKAKRNWFIGIRTPWTLSSEVVWQKTHKIGAKMFKYSALIALLGLLFPESAFLIFLIPVLFSAVFTIVYSYFQFKKEKHA